MILFVILFSVVEGGKKVTERKSDFHSVVVRRTAEGAQGGGGRSKVDGAYGFGRNS